MDYRIIWSPEALDQLGRIVHLIAEDNPPAALKMGNTIIEKPLFPSRFPRMGHVFQKLRRDDVRELAVPPYRIIYQVRDENRTVNILTVWHGAQQEPELL